MTDDAWIPVPRRLRAEELLGKPTVRVPIGESVLYAENSAFEHPSAPLSALMRAVPIRCGDYESRVPVDTRAMRVDEFGEMATGVVEDVLQCEKHI